MLKSYKLLELGSILLFIFLITNGCYLQISGTITDEKGLPLPFATIYVEGTTTGTVSNTDGEYFLDLSQPGTYYIVFQYVGHKKQVKRVDYNSKKTIINVQLAQDVNLLKELIITADAEDPAYPIIRKAIEKRTYYQNQYKSSQADLYVKGLIKMMDAPKEIMGENLGNLGGILDSMRQGILYLSESQSQYYYKAPNKTKEVMISSIKSGDNSLFTANQFNWASFNMYDEYIQIGRNVISPIAQNALSHYRYQLESAFIDSDGNTVNKIKITPKSEKSPALSGVIYITENLWNIHSADIVIFGPALRGSFIDTVTIKQVFLPVEEPDKWQLFSQTFSFNAGLIGFKIGGHFTYIFSNWQNNPSIDHIFDSRETFKVEPDALKKDTAFWSEKRPIPLTEEEKNDYTKKDSLQSIWTSKPYLDSLDKANNTPKWSNILLGYSYQNSHKNTSLSLPTPLSAIRFNAVEGFKMHLSPTWTKEDSTFRKWTVSTPLAFGFSDKQLKASIRVEYKFDNYTLGKIFVEGGRQYENFDPDGSLIEKNNSWISLWNKKNYIRLYDNVFGRIGYTQEVTNGLYLSMLTEYTQRSPLSINTQFSLRRQDRLFEENIPNTLLNSAIYETSTYWKSTIHFQWIPEQKYGSYPKAKVRQGSKWPTLKLTYQQGFNLVENNKHWNRLAFKMSDSYVSAKLWGFFQYNLDMGTFLGTKAQYFADYYHPSGNQILIPINPNLASFNLLPYFVYSTNRYYIQCNIRHHFNGKLADNIPLINKTKLKFVAGASALYVPEKGHYFEPFIGIEGFSIGPIPLFDVDYSFSFDREGFLTSGFTIRLSPIFDN